MTGHSASIAGFTGPSNENRIGAMSTPSRKWQPSGPSPLKPGASASAGSAAEVRTDRRRGVSSRSPSTCRGGSGALAAPTWTPGSEPTSTVAQTDLNPSDGGDKVATTGSTRLSRSKRLPCRSHALTTNRRRTANGNDTPAARKLVFHHSAPDPRSTAGSPATNQSRIIPVCSADFVTRRGSSGSTSRIAGLSRRLNTERRNQREGVDGVAAAGVNLEVEMRGCCAGVSGVSDVGDDLTGADG